MRLCQCSYLYDGRVYFGGLVLPHFYDSRSNRADQLWKIGRRGSIFRAMSANCCHDCHEDDSQRGNPAFRRILWIVLVVNAAMFTVEIGAGLAAGSASLQADGALRKQGIRTGCVLPCPSRCEPY